MFYFITHFQEKQYLSPVFNETINIVELDEGLDTETFFLFIVLAALAALGLVGAYQLLGNFGVSFTITSLANKRLINKSFHLIKQKKHITSSSSSSKPRVEVGTTAHEGVDYDWLPQETIKQLSKSDFIFLFQNFLTDNSFLSASIDKSPNATKPSSPRQRRTTKKE